jgi:transposase
LRGWGHGEIEPVFTGSPGARGPAGVGTSRGAPVAGKFGCTAETLRHWVRQAERDARLRPGLATDERQRLKELERENRELKRANEILKLASAFFAKAELDRRAK